MLEGRADPAPVEDREIFHAAGLQGDSTSQARRTGPDDEDIVPGGGGRGEESHKRNLFAITKKRKLIAVIS